MTRFIIRRLLLSIPVLIGIVFVVFLLARVIPGDPCVAALQERATEEVCDEFNSRYGLDRAIVPGVFKIDRAFVFKPEEVSPDARREPVRGLPRPGRHSRPRRLHPVQPARDRHPHRAPAADDRADVLRDHVRGHRGRQPRHHLRDAAQLAADVGDDVRGQPRRLDPIFVLGLVLQYSSRSSCATPCSRCRLRPAPARASTSSRSRKRGASRNSTDCPRRHRLHSNIYTINFALRADWGGFVDVVRHLILPAVALGTISLAIIARITRSSLLDVLGLDYIRTARAKGADEGRIMRRHALRNAMLPVVTDPRPPARDRSGGAVLTETIFNLSGVGLTLFEAISGRDYIVIQAFTLVVALTYVIINLVVDISYAYLDPRIRLS